MWAGEAFLARWAQGGVECGMNASKLQHRLHELAKRLQLLEFGRLQ